MTVIVTKIWKMTFLHSKNGTWAKSYRTRFLPFQSEKLKHIFGQCVSISKNPTRDTVFNHPVPNPQLCIISLHHSFTWIKLLMRNGDNIFRWRVATSFPCSQGPRDHTIKGCSTGRLDPLSPAVMLGDTLVCHQSPLVNAPVFVQNKLMELL